MKQYKSHAKRMQTAKEIDWSKHPVSFWLKFCKPLPDVEEKELKPRKWQINRQELG